MRNSLLLSWLKIRHNKSWVLGHHDTEIFIVEHCTCWRSFMKFLCVHVLNT